MALRERGDAPVVSAGRRLAVLRRTKITIVVMVALAVALTLAVDLHRTPTYRAQATVLFTVQGEPSSLGSPALLAPSQLATDLRQFSSTQVRSRASAALRAPAPPVMAVQFGTTQIGSIFVESSDPRFAARAANAYVAAYQAVVEASFVSHAEAAESAIQAQLAILQSQIDWVAGEYAATTSSQVSQRAYLSVHINSLSQQQSALSGQLNLLQLDISSYASGGQMVSPARIPRSAIAPDTERGVIVAILAELLIGIGLMLLIDYLDDRIRTKGDLEEVVGDLPIIGMVPLVGGWRDKKAARLISIEEPTSAAAEAYRSLRTSIQFAGLDQPVRTLEVTSPIPGDGKTTTVANLAVAMSTAGLRVVAVCCDLRRPRLHRYFGLSNDVGLTSVVLEGVPLADALQEVPGTQIRLLASGSRVQNPTEVTSSQALAGLLETLLLDADFVLVDSPPLLPVADAIALSRLVDGLLVVTSTWNSTRRGVRSTLDRLEQVSAPVIGVVMNGASHDDAYYLYGYGYGEPVAPSVGAGAPRAT